MNSVDTYVVVVNDNIHKYTVKTIKELKDLLDKDFVDEVMYTHLSNFDKYTPKLV